MQGPHHFSPLDEIIPPLYIAFIYGFPCPSTHKEKVLSVLENGWSRTLDERPFLAGEIEFDQSKGVRPGSLKLRIPESHLNADKIAVNDLTFPDNAWKYSYEDLRAQGMPTSKLDAEVLAPLVSGSGSTFKVVTLQINFIPGGCLLSICVSHSLMDAGSTASILQSLAKHCRDYQGSPKALVPKDSDEAESQETHPLLQKTADIAKYNKLKHRPELWHLLGLHATENIDPGSSADTAKAFRHLPAAALTPENLSTTSCIFSISPSAMQKLKQDASPDAPEWVSSGDAVVALLWRSIMRARCSFGPLDATQNARDSIVSVAMNGRKLMSPRLPSSYIGNIIFCCMTRLPMGTLLSPKTGLPETTLAIRRNIEWVKQQQVLEDAVSLASCIPNVASLKIAFKDFFGADLVTVSWVEMPFYNIDFGPIFGETGRAEFFRIPKGQFSGLCTLQPRQTNGVVDVIISLGIEEMRRLRENWEFAQYFQFLSE